MAMNSYILPKERFMCKLKPPMAKVVNKGNKEDRFEQILEKINRLETLVKPTRAKLYSESRPEEASYVKKVIIKSADMKDDMQKEAVNIAISAFEKNNVEKDVAEYIKKEFDKKHGPTWHCIVGRNFGDPD
ncbi:uncharacterized protein LOC128285417 [Gossypium arboreum]|uniref:uncharacterized protein LOC128285417 n=1 Tax=Gossypium arboreum TaxID=29729 RepID=UPI0022F1C18E|nr:uncharacterized protein LOC128285417 [Gossypium arboreum]